MIGNPYRMFGMCLGVAFLSFYQQNHDLPIVAKIVLGAFVVIITLDVCVLTGFAVLVNHVLRLVAGDLLTTAYDWFPDLPTNARIEQFLDNAYKPNQAPNNR